VSGEFLSLLENLSWDDAVASWRFRAGERTIAQDTKAHLVRTMIITHIAHHRAQIGVYLRLLGVSVPGTYGPSADEPAGAR